jgi:hypothetical protein
VAKFIETLDGLMGRILDLDARKLDLIADTTAMQAYVNGGEKLRIHETGTDKTFALNTHMRGQIATDLGIPKRYFDRMTADAPHLLSTNVNHWLQEEPNRRMIRAYTEEGSTTAAVGRAWLSPGYRRLDNVEIAKTLLPEFENLGTPVQFHQAAVSDTKLYIRALFPGVEREVKKGDIVRWGVEITNSEVGSGTLGIRGFILRLVCINGMTVAYTLKKRHVGRRIDEDGILSDQALQADDAAFWLAARDTLKATIAETRFDEIVEQLRSTTGGEQIRRVIEATQVLQKSFSFSDEERNAVVTNLAAGGDLSRWGALNAITAAAKTVPDVDRQVEMEGIGWDVANLTPKAWEAIALA